MSTRGFAPEQALPDAWVEKVWKVMRATYGAAFDRQWACPAGADPVAHVADMMGVWAEELAVYAGHPEAIAYALQNLPGFPPNLVEFKASCNRAPARPVPALPAPPAPPADPARLAEVLGKLRSAAEPAPRRGRAWALALQAREARGEALSRYARAAWREVLGVPAERRAQGRDKGLGAGREVA